MTKARKLLVAAISLVLITAVIAGAYLYQVEQQRQADEATEMLIEGITLFQEEVTGVKMSFGEHIVGFHYLNVDLKCTLCIRSTDWTVIVSWQDNAVSSSSILGTSRGRACLRTRPSVMCG